VVDAAGKLSRFTSRVASPQFGVQFYEPAASGAVLDFSFQRGVYGGTVSVEGGRSNTCLLVDKTALRPYLQRPDCRITGPVAYERHAAAFIAIGDAAGMIDPFCGEGMRHALDTGMIAARVVADGLARGASYDAIRSSYEDQRFRRWAGKRRLGGVLRGLLKYPRLCAPAFPLAAPRLLRRLWQ
jgi:hypothetical protein